MSKHDPDDNEIRALLDVANFKDKHVLEIGCGDGSKTLRYTERAAHVIAIDPDADQITLAKRQTPDHLQDIIEFHHTAFEDFAKTCTPATFDIVILAKSLC